MQNETMRTIPSLFSGEIGDTGRTARPLLNESRQLIVEVAGFLNNQVDKTAFHIAESVPAALESIISEFEVPTGKTAKLCGAEACGVVDAHFKVYIYRDSKWSQIGEKHNSWNNRNVTFGCIENLAAGEKVKLTAVHQDAVEVDFPGAIFLKIM